MALLAAISFAQVEDAGVVFVKMIQCKEIIMNESHGALRTRSKNSKDNITSLTRTVSQMRTFWFLVDEYYGNAQITPNTGD